MPSQPSTPPLPPPGQLLGGRYRVDRVLGEGGMGVVLAATDLQLDRAVALKMMRTGLLDSPGAVARFEREARAAVKLSSEHVARVFDVGRAEGGAPFIVMEYLDGEGLDAMLERAGTLPLEVAVEIVLQVCEAVGEAHARGIVHRDLKPANLFVLPRPSGRPFAKVLDFGISKVEADEQNGSLTMTGATVGSPLYMAPEQMRSARRVDQRADVWALGVILFELLSGRLPFEAQSVTELAIMVAQDPAPSVRTLRPELPEALAVIVARCLEKDPDQRYRSVENLAADLESVVGRRSAGAASFPSDPRSSAPRLRDGSDALAFEATQDATPSPGVLSPISSKAASWNDGGPPGRSTASRRRTWPLAGAALAVGLLAIAGLWLRARAPAVGPVATAPPAPAAIAVDTAPTVPSKPSAEAPVEVPAATSAHAAPTPAAPYAAPRPASKPTPVQKDPLKNRNW